jgi:hypothetical protein
MTHLRRLLVAFGSGIVAMLAGAPAAFAVTQPPGPGSATTTGTATPQSVHITTGMVGWEIALIAVGSAVVAALAVLLAERLRRSHQLSSALSRA